MNELQDHGHRLYERMRMLCVDAPRQRTAFVQFAQEHGPEIERLLTAHGALLLRGFDVDRGSFGPAVDCLWGDRLDYVYRSTPRHSVDERVFTATTYPAQRTIPLHCEEAYQHDWPMRLAFFCEAPAEHGGETLLADMRAVTHRLPEDLLTRFRCRGVRYIRNYTDGMDLPWSEVFQTHDRSEVERFCRAAGIEFWWRPDGSLRTVQNCQATAIHPELEEEIFFNQAHLFHVSSLGKSDAEDLISVLGMEHLPRHACFGDGTPIPAADLDAIRSAYETEEVAVRWRADDVLLIDNMQVAHGRQPFCGKRSVLVAMSRLWSSKRSGEAVGHTGGMFND